MKTNKIITLAALLTVTITATGAAYAASLSVTTNSGFQVPLRSSGTTTVELIQPAAHIDAFQSTDRYTSLQDTMNGIDLQGAQD